MQQKIDKMEEQHKHNVDQMEKQHKHKVDQMEEQLHKLKIENKFLDGFYKAFNDFEKSEGEDSVG
jgi:exonuclease VII large subunit